MKISTQTLQVLKNYASINPNLLVKPGSVLSTISTNKNIFAKASVTESFPASFAIYDMQQFLGVVSIFEDPDFTFNEHSVTIASGNKSIEYVYTQPEMVVAPSDSVAQKIAVNNPEITFNLPAQTLNEVIKATSILQLDKINVVTENGTVHVVVADPKNPSSNKFSVSVEGTSSMDLSMVFAAENLKFIQGDYKVSISSSGISSFKNEKLDLEYFVMADVKSKKKA
jgi:gp45 sliding clamp, C terminal